MCSIVASFSKDKIKELIKINQYRGNFSYSISLLDINEMIIKEQAKDFGMFNEQILNNCYESDSIYYICHVQAPTGGLLKDLDRIHPTKLNNSYLWHNGIITPRGMNWLQEFSWNKNVNFDTKALHNQLYNSVFDDLSTIEGLFSCLYLDGYLTMFRTKHGKLYIDNDLNVSSERFENSKCINYDTIYQFDFKNKLIKDILKFKTKKFNIIVKGEM